jgi:hypothetical protein
MKKMFIIVCASFFAACNNTGTTENKETGTEPAPSTEKIDYAYLPSDHGPDNWDRGDQKNIALVLKSLKAFETGNVEEALAAFADSVWWSADYFDQKVSKDSLRAMFTEGWKNMASVKIVMSDYEAVISKDKKDEWVTLWYKQIVTDKKGNVDSMSVVDDAKIENGKITVLDEKSRKYPKPKK